MCLVCIDQVILGVWEGTKMFPYKLRVTAALLFAISAFERFHRNALALLLEEGVGSELSVDAQMLLPS